MSEIPILAVGPVLLVSIQTELNDRVTVELQQALLARIKETGAEGTLIDITAVDVVDSFIGRVISETGKMAHIMGAKVVLVGMRPEVAITLLEMGLHLDGIDTERDVETGLRALGYELTKVAPHRGEHAPSSHHMLRGRPGNGTI